jgi:hypothetical protein
MLLGHGYSSALATMAIKIYFARMGKKHLIPMF